MNLKQIQPPRPGRFSNASQRRALIGIGAKKTKLEDPFEHGEVINYTLDGVSREEGIRSRISL